MRAIRDFYNSLSVIKVVGFSLFIVGAVNIVTGFSLSIGLYHLFVNTISLEVGYLILFSGFVSLYSAAITVTLIGLSVPSLMIKLQSAYNQKYFLQEAAEKGWRKTLNVLDGLGVSTAGKLLDVINNRPYAINLREAVAGGYTSIVAYIVDNDDYAPLYQLDHDGRMLTEVAIMNERDDVAILLLNAIKKDIELELSTQGSPETFVDRYLEGDLNLIYQYYLQANLLNQNVISDFFVQTFPGIHNYIEGIQSSQIRVIERQTTSPVSSVVSSAQQRSDFDSVALSRGERATQLFGGSSFREQASPITEASAETIISDTQSLRCD